MSANQARHTWASRLVAASLIAAALEQRDDASLARIRAEVEEMTAAFPLYAPAGVPRGVLAHA